MIQNLLDRYILPEHHACALVIIARESGGIPGIENLEGSTASGLWQILASTWAGAAAQMLAAGVEVPPPFYEARFDPEWNFRVAAWLIYEDVGSWRHWAEQDGYCGA
jgi:muramidase (phage lysozyme)